MTAHFVEKRRPPFWLAALALSCATSKSSESQLQLSGKEETQTTAVEHREFTSTEHEGPWRVVTYRFSAGQPKVASETDPSGGPFATGTTSGERPRESGNDLSSGGAPAVPDQGQLLSVTVEDHFGRDITAQSSSDGFRGAEQRVEVKADAKAKETSSVRLGLSLWAYALIAGALAALAAAAWHFKPPLLLKLLARIFP